MLHYGSAKLLLVLIFLSTIFVVKAYGLPSFAIREKVACTLCHENGSAPHLTRTGFFYRRAGFRFPDDIGNEEKDNAAMDAIRHIAVGINVDFRIANETPSASTSNTKANGFSVREVEIWPATGAFLGNFGVWSELDMSPTVVDRGGTASTGAKTTGGKVQLGMADLRYVSGSPNSFFSVRAGLIAPEGYGASDQWIDDGQIPLMEQVSGFYNQQTLALPLGAMQTPQLGVELGYSTDTSFVTFGIYNGLDGTVGDPSAGQAPSAAPTLTDPHSPNGHDYKVQYDQFIGNLFSFTGVYYNGRISLYSDPTNSASIPWDNHYQLSRAYLTYHAIPNQFEIYVGGANGSYEYVNTGNTAVAGKFRNDGAFIGSNWYVKPHLTLTLRLDTVTNALDTPIGTPKSSGHSTFVGVNLPYENNMWVIHYAVLNSTLNNDPLLDGEKRDFRAEWRFLY